MAPLQFSAIAFSDIAFIAIAIYRLRFMGLPVAVTHSSAVAGAVVVVGGCSNGLLLMSSISAFNSADIWFSDVFVLF